MTADHGARATRGADGMIRVELPDGRTVTIPARLDAGQRWEIERQRAHDNAARPATERLEELRRQTALLLTLRAS
jgi:hypothetical protein